MVRRLLDGICIFIVSTIIIKGLDKYGGIEMIKSLFQTFVVELWPIWFGLGIAIIYWFIRGIISIRKCIRINLKFDKKLDELGDERRKLLTDINSFYNGISNRLNKIENKSPPTSL